MLNRNHSPQRTSPSVLKNQLRSKNTHSVAENNYGDRGNFPNKQADLHRAVGRVERLELFERLSRLPSPLELPTPGKLFDYAAKSIKEELRNLRKSGTCRHPPVEIARRAFHCLVSKVFLPLIYSNTSIIRRIGT